LKDQGVVHRIKTIEAGEPCLPMARARRVCPNGGFRSIRASCVRRARPENSTRKKTAEYWYAKSEKDANLAPQRKLANEKPQGVTTDYDELIKSWKKV
jgi:hypothetical protein